MTELVSSICPYCGEPVDVVIDEGGDDTQSYVEDCPVCCRPWQVEAGQDEEGNWSVVLRTSDQ